PAVQKGAAGAATGGPGVRVSRGGDPPGASRRGGGGAGAKLVAARRQRAAADPVVARRCRLGSRSRAARRARAAHSREAPRHRSAEGSMTPLLFGLRGVTLGLCWFLVVNALASVCVVRTMGRLARRGASRSPRFWFAVRIFPATLAAAFVAVLFIPSYVAYEPRGLVEGFNVTLVASAVGGLVLCLIAAMRGLLSWRAAARRTAAWMATAQPLAFAGTRIPAFEIDAEAPVMAL